MKLVLLFKKLSINLLFLGLSLGKKITTSAFSIKKCVYINSDALLSPPISMKATRVLEGKYSLVFPTRSIESLLSYGLLLAGSITKINSLPSTSGASKCSLFIH